MHFKTVNVNHGWMSTVDEKTGYGNIKREDFVKLLETHGFRVAEAKDLTLEYKLSKKFAEGFMQNTISTGFPELVGVEREEFFKEYIRESLVPVIVFSDNLAVVHAWRRGKSGAFSASARIASFLVSVAAANIELASECLARTQNGFSVW